MRTVLASLLALSVALAGCAEPADDPPRGDAGDDDGASGGVAPDSNATDDDVGAGNATDDDGMTPPADDATQNVEEMLGGDLEVHGEDVEYTANVTGYAARPATAGPYPGVVVVHEWWGLNDQIRQASRLLASHGYEVLAVDLFGQVATTPQDALAQVRALDQANATANMRAAAAWLRTEANATSVSSLGWCFGGGQSLQLALSGEPLAGTIIYYGQLVNDTTRLRAIEWPVLGIFGEEDTSIPVAAVRDFQEALNASGVENDVHVYPGVGHAFANPSGANWAPVQTSDAWQKTLAFLEENAG